jgi:L-malate glycosyltransferase
MKLLVYAHQLEVGGTQVNAIDLAVALRDLHHWDPVLFATPGPMVERVQRSGLRFLPAPHPGFHPSPARMSALRAAVRSERPELLWVWDWWQCVDALYAVHLPLRMPMVVTDMSMSLIRLLPKRVPTTFGTQQIVDQAIAAGRGPVAFIPPPVDVRANAPGAVDAGLFRQSHALEAGDFTVVTVSRLDQAMKRESLFRTIDAVAVVGPHLPVRFVIVGDGPARRDLEQHANRTNVALGRQAITFAGELLDPRPAYAAADVVVGMGGSALRGMAFGKPVIVVGQGGFAVPFTPGTAPSFLYRGFYGRGEGTAGNDPLAQQIRSLYQNPQRAVALGEFSRDFVLQHFALETVSTRLATFCRDAVRHQPRLPVVFQDGLRTAAVYIRERRFLTRRRLRVPARAWDRARIPSALADRDPSSTRLTNSLHGGATSMPVSRAPSSG